MYLHGALEATVVGELDVGVAPAAMSEADDVLAVFGEGLEQRRRRGRVTRQVALVRNQGMRRASYRPALGGEVDVAVAAEAGIARPLVAGKGDEAVGLVELRAEQGQSLPEPACDLEVVALVGGGIEKGALTCKLEIPPRTVGADGLLRLAVQVRPERSQGCPRHDAHGVRPRQCLAALVLHAQFEVCGGGHPQPSDLLRELAGRKAYSRRQAVHGHVGAQADRRLHPVTGISPLVLGLELERKRFARLPHRRQHGHPAHGRARGDADGGLTRQWLEHLRRDRVDQHVELEGVLTKGLQTHAGRTLGRVAETHGNGVALTQEAVYHGYVQGAVPGPHVALGVVAAAQHGVVRRRHRGVSRPFSIVELRARLVGSEAETDADCPGVVDAVATRGVDQGEGLKRAGLERPLRRQRRLAEVLGGDGRRNGLALQPALELFTRWHNV